MTLTAVPLDGYVFTKWGGDLNGRSNPASVIMNAAKTVTATFVRSDARYVITVGVDSNDRGTVRLYPLQPANGYKVNESVSLTASASRGYAFSHWSGDLTDLTSGLSTIVLFADGDKALTANFNPTLTISSDPANGGTVTLEPVQSPQGYTTGREVTVTAAAAEGYRFDHWSGDVSETRKKSVTITMDSAKELTAIFIEPQSFAWWWIALGVGLLLLTLIVVRVFYVIATRRDTEV